ncbi:MAG: tRNA (adenosine(37)-N6)-dimethylallyltransferase MiaA, partial [Porticoccaceae bacterium]|nr:tRNA (adenosine(37)-N6)-dimethylallyltransferase MiaA [Porticoccaceae bacterium]
AEQGWPAMHQKLAQLDPESAARIHPNHSQRLQRALEVCLTSGQPFSKLLAQSTDGVASINDNYRVVQMAIATRDRALLHRRIEQRFATMMEQGGLDEVQRLYRRGDLHPDLPAIRAVGYRQAWQYLAGELDYDQMIHKAVVATRQLAKRQLTWLRGWQDLHWLYSDTSEGELIPAEEILQNALKILRNGAIYKGTS